MSLAQPVGNENRVRIDSALIDPDLDRTGYRGTKWKLMEVSQLYLPKPMMEVMLHCILKNGTR